ncbi:NADH-quinone oxidoreductase subunit J [Streptomyces albidoflavus]|uniref:NADH-quinone oxidoreductase subunit J n=1 Tax=Streptomyces albidoflavus TaxID=1886 RepID=UPI000775D7D5|nr:NADH-quinone oxidoreductase subunit J [Streptomyces albidoflavus]AMM06738.1 NADH:ubiquinone oxidoreductase chain J [Streptomyces albidoflavus]WSD56851.1 NADH-quinone oxidoreductase subunit J [Streptomyces albidoflavus]WSU13703.1 NADH-quinone oxidoreductase subunit J [Streptomyces albidoflavus]SCE32019.1 NADH:ubiquinone oxidoreductase subunit 6 (chain J) [Streptomyces sp. IgraMP-1]
MLSAVLAWVLALCAVTAGVLVFRFDSMARATFALLASLLCVAGEVLLLGIQYLGVVIVLMMTIEMAVMAVFMIMFMMNPAGLMPMAMLHNTRAAAALCAALFALLATGVLTADWPRATGRPPADPTFELGMSLMGPQMLTMMTLGTALFATIVATVVLATRRGRYDRWGDDLRAARPDDPARGGVGR